MRARCRLISVNGKNSTLDVSTTKMRKLAGKCGNWRVIFNFQKLVLEVTIARKSALPALGFYPKILGFFEAVGIFLGFYFEK
jgi:hypothetical protein